MIVKGDPGVDYRVLYLAQNGRCFHCHIQLNPRPNNDRHYHLPKTAASYPGWTKDHLKPRGDGHGLDGNVVLSCYDCNIKKGSTQPDDDALARFAKIMVRYQQIVAADWVHPREALNRAERQRRLKAVANLSKS